MTSLTLLPTRHQHGNAGRYVPFLKAWRQHAGWSQFTLAAHSGVWPSTVYRLEHGGVARPHMVDRLAEALGIDDATLLHRPPTDDEAVTPTTRVRAVTTDDGELAFSIPRRWHRVDGFGWQPLPLLVEALDTRTTGIPASRLEAIARQQAPATLAEITAIARALGCDILQLIGYV